jgi:3-hydroxyisobutyrate dehydrogenase-like beta-hydroxyacid dehydrogenase
MLARACTFSIRTGRDGAVRGERRGHHDSARNVGDATSIAFACLPGAAISQAVPAEVVWGSALGVYVEMSTIGNRAMEGIADQLLGRGITLVDCPISGGPKGARASTQSVIAAGRKRRWRRCGLGSIASASRCS